MKLQPLTCKNCGGAINRSTYICEYCGTAYENRSGIPYIIETQQKPCKVLQMRSYVDAELLRSDDYPREVIVNQAMSNIRDQLAKALEDYMRVETTFDPRTMRQVITAQVRVIEPYYRF